MRDHIPICRPLSDLRELRGPSSSCSAITSSVIRSSPERRFAMAKVDRERKEVDEGKQWSEVAEVADGVV